MTYMIGPLHKSYKGKALGVLPKASAESLAVCLGERGYVVTGVENSR